MRNDTILPGLISGAAALFVATSAIAQASNVLTGAWRAQDGSNTVAVRPCADGDGLCATVTEERAEPGEPSSVGQLAISGLRPGRNGWSGRYVLDGENWRAQVSVVSNDTVDFRVCPVAFVCETVRYLRVTR